MTILTLSPEQQAKLLELFKVFFPEYNRVRISNFHSSGILVVQYMWTVSDYAEIPFHNIHWYQLCLTELSERILKSLSQESPFDLGIYNGETLAQLMLKDKSHPVDYLYKFWHENE